MSSPDANVEVYGDVCIPNISGPERRKRLRFGIVAAVVSLAILAAMLVTRVDAIWRLALVLPFASAATGFFQWRDKT